MARRNKSPRLDIVHNDLIGAQKRLSELKGGFSGVSRRWNGPIQLKELFRAARLPGVAAICGALFVWYLLTSPWPPVLGCGQRSSFECDGRELGTCRQNELRSGLSPMGATADKRRRRPRSVRPRLTQLGQRPNFPGIVCPLMMLWTAPTLRHRGGVGYLRSKGEIQRADADVGGMKNASTQLGQTNW